MGARRCAGAPTPPTNPACGMAPGFGVAAPTTGGGSPGVSASNGHLEAGDVTPEALMADIADGLYVTGLFGQGVNMVTGDYSRGATGFRIRNGEIAGPVAEMRGASSSPPPPRTTLNNGGDSQLWRCHIYHLSSSSGVLFLITLNSPMRPPADDSLPQSGCAAGRRDPSTPSTAAAP